MVFYFGCAGPSLLRVGFLQLWRAGATLCCGAVCGLLIVVASLVVEHRLQACGLQQLWLAGSRAQARSLWRTGLVAPRHVGSSRTRAQTCVTCIGRRILFVCLFVLNFIFILNYFYIFTFYLIFYTAGSYELSILYVLVYICQSQSPNSSHHHHHPRLSPLGVHTFVLYICVSISASKQVHLYHFSRFRIYALIYDICFSLSDLLHSL